MQKEGLWAAYALAALSVGGVAYCNMQVEELKECEKKWHDEEVQAQEALADRCEAVLRREREATAQRENLKKPSMLANIISVPPAVRGAHARAVHALETSREAHSWKRPQMVSSGAV